MLRRCIAKFSAVVATMLIGISSTAVATPSADQRQQGLAPITVAPSATPTTDPTPKPSGTNTEAGSEDVPEPSSPASVEPTPAKPPTDGALENSPAEPIEEDLPSAQESDIPSDSATVDSEPSTPAEPFSRGHSRAHPAQTRQGCDYATGSGGAYADTLCWIDFSKVQTAEQGLQDLTTRYRSASGLFNYKSVLDLEDGATVHTTGNHALVGVVRYGDIKDVGIEVQLDETHQLTAKLDIRKPGSAGGNRSRVVEAVQFPTYGTQGSATGAFLGRNGFYNLPENSTIAPAIYQTQGRQGLNRNQAITEVTLRDIQLHRWNDDGTTDLVSDYSIVVADAESTNQDESIRWNTTGTHFEWLPNKPTGTGKTAVMGNACVRYVPALNSSSAEARCEGGPDADRTGTPMLHTAPGGGTFTITTTMTGDGQQGIAFGILTARAQVNVDVEARVLDSAGQPRTDEDFTASMTILGRTTTTSTGTDNESSSGAVTNTVSGAGNPVEFDASIDGDYWQSYAPFWTCTKTGIEGQTPQQYPESPTAPPHASPGDFAWLMPGEFIDCTVTYKPSYLELSKEVHNGDTESVNGPEDFLLVADGTAGTAGSVVETIGASAEEAQRFPVTAGNYRLTEDWADSASEDNWQYGYQWSDLICRDGDGNEITGSALDLEESVDGSIEAATLLVPSITADNTTPSDISCTYTNEALQPQLNVTKESDVPADELVTAEQDIAYTLTFDNSQGTAQVVADHVDHLQDVLDDAHLDADSITSDGLDVEFEEDPNNPRLVISGTVGPGETHQVTYVVTVKAQEEDFPQRDQAEDPLNGYVLQNFLTPRLDDNGDEITNPQACPEPGVGVNTHCDSTRDAISAWTVDKQSLPVDGARLNYGGNTHYVLSARKLNDETEISNLSFHDDLTHVFKSAGWDPAAAVPGGAKPRGIYFIDADGNTLDANGEINGDADAPQPAYGAEAVGEPATQDDRWILESQTIETVPSNAVTVEMWFAVEAGQQTNSDIPGAEAWGGQRPPTGSKYVNYGFASASTDPVQCALPQDGPDVSTSPDDQQPADERISEACRTLHEVNSGHFTIRKDAVGTGINVPNNDAYGDSSTGLWNLVGHEFEIRDDIDGQPSEYPSQYLCRVDYRPDGDTPWDGTFTAHPGDRSLDDWDAGSGDDSQTLNEIRAWNNDQANVDDPRYPLPECGVFNAQPEGSGGQTGRYRGMNLQPVLEPGEQGEPRDFWLVETKAPTHQISLDGSQSRPVPGVQELAEPIPFTMWPSNDGEHLGGPSFYGKRQLDVQDKNGQYLERCSPGAAAHQRPVACVNSTGYLMLVQDTVPPALPLTGGQWLGLLTAIGAGLVAIALLGSYVKRQRAAKTQLL